MSDYVKRDDMVRFIEDFSFSVLSGAETIKQLLARIDEIPSADVVAAPRWIKCEDELPPFVEDVLLLFESSMAVGYLRAKRGSETVWGISDENGCGVNAHSKPMYWMPLPERTKELNE